MGSLISHANPVCIFVTLYGRSFTLWQFFTSNPAAPGVDCRGMYAFGMSCLMKTWVVLFFVIEAILAMAGLTTVKIDFDGLHSSAVCSSKSIGSGEFLEGEIGSVILSLITVVDMKEGNARTHSLFSAWK